MPHILIVDDDPDTCNAVAGILNKYGYQTTSAANGWEAMLQVDGQRYDLILLDLMMPGLDGSSFLSILRGYSARAAIPVVVMTALDLPEAAARVNPGQTHGIVEKGRDTFYNELVNRVRMIVGPDHPADLAAN